VGVQTGGGLVQLKALALELHQQEQHDEGKPQQRPQRPAGGGRQFTGMEVVVGTGTHGAIDESATGMVQRSSKNHGTCDRQTLSNAECTVPGLAAQVEVQTVFRPIVWVLEWYPT
jgi:hypothetical protein